MSDKLRWGVLGTARIVRKTIPALQATKNGEVVAIASRTQEKAAEYAHKHGLSQAFGSYESLLAAPDIDAVYLALPNALHLEWILKSLDAGKHVLCEKPLAMSAAECGDGHRAGAGSRRRLWQLPRRHRRRPNRHKHGGHSALSRWRHRAF
jgi:xylose dehydrogenase (NAD/NADP)